MIDAKRLRAVSDTGPVDVRKDARDATDQWGILLCATCIAILRIRLEAMDVARKAFVRPNANH